MAQDTRAEAIRQEQADKQRVVAPPEKNRAEKFIDRIDKWGWLTSEPRGFYPVVDSVYAGGGFAFGLGTRRPIGDDGAINAMAAYSINSFWRTQTDVTLPSFASNRGRVTLTAGYLDAPDVKYYGIGQDSAKEDKTFFGYTPFEAGARVDFGVGRYLSIGGGANYLDINIFEGPTRPSIHSRFSPADTPGLAETSSITSTAAPAPSSTGVDDWATPAREGLPDPVRRLPRGGSRSVFLPLTRSRGDAADSADAGELGHRPSWSRHGDGHQCHGNRSVLMLPSLGGGKTLRGYPDMRFRDRHRLVMNAELRWTPARFLDMALFYDAGKVAAEKRDLDFRGLEDSYGIGMRIIGVKGYAFRVDVARSREHAARLLVSAGGAF